MVPLVIFQTQTVVLSKSGTTLCPSWQNVAVVNPFLRLKDPCSSVRKYTTTTKLDTLPALSIKNCRFLCCEKSKHFCKILWNFAGFIAHEKKVLTAALFDAAKTSAQNENNVFCRYLFDERMPGVRPKWDSLCEAVCQCDWYRCERYFCYHNLKTWDLWKENKNSDSKVGVT